MAAGGLDRRPEEPRFELGPLSWGRRVVPQEELRRLNLQRFHFGRRIAIVGGIFFPTMAIVIGASTWWVITERSVPGAWAPGMVAFASLFTIFITWVGVTAYTNYAVAATEEGLLVYERSPLHRVAWQRPLRWEDLRGVVVGSATLREVLLQTNGFPVLLSLNQAKVVLGHPCFPLSARIPESLQSLLDGEPVRKVQLQ
jgi:hypothetical protein